MLKHIHTRADSGHQSLSFLQVLQEGSHFRAIHFGNLSARKDQTADFFLIQLAQRPIGPNPKTFHGLNRLSVQGTEHQIAPGKAHEITQDHDFIKTALVVDQNHIFHRSMPFPFYRIPSSVVSAVVWAASSSVCPDLPRRFRFS